MRLVSLLPSATEIVYALGLGDDLVGVTFECEVPASYRAGTTVVVGGRDTRGMSPGDIDAYVKAQVAAGADLYTLHAGALAGLDPDLILTQDLCRVCALPSGRVADAVDHLGCRAEVLSLDPYTLDDVLESIRAVGAAARVPERAEALVDGLRGRRPAVVEWKGGHRDPGDESVPADLRIDHVYLVSCKYLSKVLHNASPATVFDRLLAGGPGRRSDENWFDAVAAAEHQRLYQVVRRTHGAALVLADDEPLPEQVRSLTGPQREALRRQVPKDWGPECAAAYQELVAATAERSAERWRAALAEGTGRERSLLWRILRLSSAPYFVLGTGPVTSLRLRVATPWDWNQAFELRRFEVLAEPGGQARVGWRALVRTRASDDGPGGDEVEVAGHVEVRWSHGRFGGHPEAKVYLDTPHGQVPGYFPLA